MFFKIRYTFIYRLKYLFYIIKDYEIWDDTELDNEVLFCKGNILNKFKDDQLTRI